MLFDLLHIFSLFALLHIFSMLNISSSLTFYFCLSCPKTCLLNVQYMLLCANSIHLFLTGFILMYIIFAIMTSECNNLLHAL